MPLSEHPWPLLTRARDRDLGLTLTSGQVVELMVDWDALVEKANAGTRQQWAELAAAQRLNLALAERVVAQSELLSKAANRPTPEPTRAT